MREYTHAPTNVGPAAAKPTGAVTVGRASIPAPTAVPATRSVHAATDEVGPLVLGLAVDSACGTTSRCTSGASSGFV